MAGHEENLKRIEIVAEGLGRLADESIFIGGACTQFYVPNPRLRDFRPTKDVDCIVQIHSYAEFAAYSEKLRELGFKNDRSENAPIVRWVYKGILVDTIPEESSIVGYRNIRWFREGREHIEKRRLPSGRDINILPLAYFFATKLESWRDRGYGDFLASPDIEDIISIIDGNDTLDDVLTAPTDVRDYVIQSLVSLAGNNDFRRSLAGHIGFEETAAARAKDVLDKIASVAQKNKTTTRKDQQ